MHHGLIAISLLALCASQQSSAQPGIRIRRSSDALLTGEPVYVKVKTAEDGHLPVLRMDTEGRIRGLFRWTPPPLTMCGAARSVKCGVAAAARRLSPTSVPDEGWCSPCDVTSPFATMRRVHTA